MAGKIQELRSLHSDNSDNLAKEIGEMWNKYDDLRAIWINELNEVRTFVFATDTTSTSVDELGWKNKTTIPKLCQIRDNLHANYISALFPHENWVRWEGDSLEEELLRKKRAIEGYIATKARQSKLRNVMSELLYDYIDAGVAFAADKYERKTTYDPVTTQEIKGYSGPKGYRIDPMDIVFNPLAPDFDSTPKLVRKVLNIGEITELASKEPEWEAALQRSLNIRQAAGSYNRSDFNKALMFQIDGFGDLREYYGSRYVEVLTFEGDFYDELTMKVEKDQQIIVIDRSIVVTKRMIPHPLGKRRIQMAGWRKRPNNLYAMGPLANLVGMQYRIDHLENLKADALDLMVHPPLVLKGDVDPFTWHPNAQIRVTEDGDVTELGVNLQGVSAANTEIALLEQRMEEYAGAPKQAMGMRTPGEKTAFEVQSLENAAGRIFQEKIENFEINLLEPLLNSMLATAVQEGDVEETVRAFDDELGVTDFLNVTTNDLSAIGTLRPIGARHFGQQAQLIQNLAQTINGPMGQMIAPHVSGKQLALLLEDSLQLRKYNLVRPFVGLTEQQEAAEYANVLQQEGEVDAATPTEPEMV